MQDCESEKIQYVSKPKSDSSKDETDILSGPGMGEIFLALVKSLKKLHSSSILLPQKPNI